MGCYNLFDANESIHCNHKCIHIVQFEDVTFDFRKLFDPWRSSQESKEHTKILVSLVLASYLDFRVHVFLFWLWILQAATPREPATTTTPRAAQPSPRTQQQQASNSLPIKSFPQQQQQLMPTVSYQSSSYRKVTPPRTTSTQSLPVSTGHRESWYSGIGEKHPLLSASSSNHNL